MHSNLYFGTYPALLSFLQGDHPLQGAPQEKGRAGRYEAMQEGQRTSEHYSQNLCNLPQDPWTNNQPSSKRRRQDLHASSYFKKITVIVSYFGIWLYVIFHYKMFVPMLAFHWKMLSWIKKMCATHCLIWRWFCMNRINDIDTAMKFKSNEFENNPHSSEHKVQTKEQGMCWSLRWRSTYTFFHQSNIHASLQKLRFMKCTFLISEASSNQINWLKIFRKGIREMWVEDMFLQEKEME